MLPMTHTRLAVVDPGFLDVALDNQLSLDSAVHLGLEDEAGANDFWFFDFLEMVELILFQAVRLGIDHA